MSRIVAWGLFAVSLALAPAGVVLAAVGEIRGLDLPVGRGSELQVELFAALAGLLFATIGLVIVRKGRSNAIGWFFLVSAVGLVLLSVSLGYADLAYYGGEERTGARWIAWMGSAVFVIAPVFVAPCLILQLFPVGRPMPGRWTTAFLVSVVLGTYVAVAPALDQGELGSYPGVENPAGVPWLSTLIVDPTWGVAILGLFALSVASIVTRFRRSRGIERLQLRWLVVSGVAVVIGFVLTFATEDVEGVWWNTLSGTIGFTAFALMPVSVGMAILRYRLYEIDRIVSRTLSYALLTVVLGAAYVGLVLAGQAVFSSFAGGSNLAIAVSTLVVAALFLPLRARVQGFVDRRFYRRRYDAQRTLEAFASRLRDEVELGVLTAELHGVAVKTMQPVSVSLWLRNDPVTPNPYKGR